ncbi:MAG: peptide-methionine (S)-S-oxide reductase [Deltaproteobacteria bacterium]|nr:MAG: peptide-methionine (S)-S-oxide reductase [Deltaproteobacteria bacterium]
MAKVLFGAGCFWGVEEAFKKLEGVVETKAGYSGGTYPNPTYDDICRGDTGHAEVVKVVYDPEIISLEELLNCFWEIHDPTTLNRQGPDIGHQYRSAVFCFKEDDLEQVMRSKERIESKLDTPVVTEVMLVKDFYEAEEYHQCYFEKNK